MTNLVTKQFYTEFVHKKFQTLNHLAGWCCPYSVFLGLGNKPLNILAYIQYYSINILGFYFRIVHQRPDVAVVAIILNSWLYKHV